MAEAIVETGDYHFDLPNEVELQHLLTSQFEYWKDRNKFIRDARDMIAGRNPISAPASTQYQVRVGHTYAFTSITHEKASRYMQQPNVQVIPATIDERAKSTRLEKALFSAFYEMERHGDGDVWSRLTDDVITLDMGVELIEAAPAAFWPEIVAYNKSGDPSHPMQDKAARDQYKKEQGIPIRTTYCPLEDFYPVYEGGTLVECFASEQRSLRDVLNNPLFDTSRLVFYRQGPEKDIRTQVTIVRYCNQNVYAYYAMTPATSRNIWPQYNPTSPVKGPLILLHAYEHNLGRVLYNAVGGRFGGWKTVNTRVEPVGRAMLDINQKLDEMLSQGLTNIGARYWPNLAFYLDPERRGWLESGETPQTPRVNPGDPLLMYTGEELRPVFDPQDDPMFMWVFDQLKEQLGRLGGSAVLFGGREPGVDTGYHQALMISRAEHLDEKMEQHLVQGAINRATLVFALVRSIGERAYTHYFERESGTNNKRLHWTYIDPEDLTPMPALDARVRKTRPVDLVAAVRTARDAVSDIGPDGPLLSYDTAREEILGRDSPDLEERKIRLQREKSRVIESGVITQAVVDRLNLRLVEKQRPEVTEEQVEGVDPALLEAAGNIAGQNPPGGINPQLLDQVNRSSIGPGRRRGMAVTDPQPEARIGEEVAAAANAGLGI